MDLPRFFVILAALSMAVRLVNFYCFRASALERVACLEAFEARILRVNFNAMQVILEMIQEQKERYIIHDDT